MITENTIPSDKLKKYINNISVYILTDLFMPYGINNKQT